MHIYDFFRDIFSVFGDFSRFFGCKIWFSKILPECKRNDKYEVCASPTPSYTGNKGVIQVWTSISASDYLNTNTLQLVDTRGHGVEDVAAASVSGNLYPFCPSCWKGSIWKNGALAWPNQWVSTCCCTCTTTICTGNFIDGHGPTWDLLR